MPETYFDDWIATRYERLWPELFDPAVVDPAVDFLARLAGTRSALELGVGTGRIALPLARLGIAVQGIELSRPMVDQLRRQPHANAVGVTLGDFATTTVDDTFGLGSASNSARVLVSCRRTPATALSRCSGPSVT